MLVLAHLQHWLWLLYLPPILIVAASITATKLREKRGRNDHDPESGR